MAVRHVCFLVAMLSGISILLLLDGFLGRMFADPWEENQGILSVMAAFGTGLAVEITGLFALFYAVKAFVRCDGSFVSFTAAMMIAISMFASLLPLALASLELALQ